MRSPVMTALAIAAGLIVLLGYLIPPEWTSLAYIQAVRAIFIGWAVVLAGIAAWVGVIHLFLTHVRRMSARREADRYSVLVVVAFLVTAVAGMILTPADPRFQQAVLAIQVPVEASLLGLLAVTLVFASMRLFQRRKGVMAVVFVISAVFFLLLGAGLLMPLQEAPLLGALIGFFERLPIAGGRGILIGIALGSLMTGLRILLGADRPYSG